MVVIGVYNLMDRVFVGQLISEVAMGAVLSTQSFAFIPLWGMSQGFQNAAGTNYGAKEYGRVKTVTKGFIAGATALALIFYLPVELVPKTVLCTLSLKVLSVSLLKCTLTV